MKLFDKIKSLFFAKEIKKPLASVSEPKISMREREDKRYGAGKLTLQKLYEKWSCKEKWLLYDEGIPLLFGVQPGIKEPLEEEISNKIQSLWEHAQECVQKKLLFVINMDKPVIEWEVRPLDLYRWATVSRISMPDEFNMLMAFVSQTVMPSDVISSGAESLDVEDMRYQKHREIVLGAATSLLINASESCQDKKGRVAINRIVKNIIENENQWFGDDKLLLTETSMTDLIKEYLKLTKPLV